jgi:tetratricopeptide (TPR) repeat protein
VAVPLLLLAYELLRSRAEPMSKAAAAHARHPVDKSTAGSAAGRPPLATLLLPYVSMALAVAAYLAMRIHALGALLPAETRRLPLGENIWTAFAVFWRYFQVQLLPVRLHAFYYMKPNTTALDPVVLAGIALSAALVAAMWWLRRKKRPEAWAVPLYVLPLAPALLIPYASVGLLMAERYVYLSSVAFCWAAGAGLAAAIRWAARQKTSPWKVVAACAAVVLLAGAYSVRTAARNTDWRDEIAFYQRTITDFPGFPRAYLNLGEALMRRDRLGEAREVTETAVRLDSSYPDPHMNLGLICRMEGDLGCAETHLRQAVLLGREQNNRFVVSRALTNLAVTYRAAGRLPESVAASEEALAVDPQFAGAHNNLAFALLTADRPDDAIPHLTRALELDPTLDVAWSNLGLAYSMKGDLAKSLELLRRAEHMNPGNAETHARAAEVLLGVGRVQDAIQELSLALQIDPENARARSLHPPEPR